MSKSRFSLFCLVFLLFVTSLAISSIAATGPVELIDVLAVDRVGVRAGLFPQADLLSVGLYRDTLTGSWLLRVSCLSLAGQPPGWIVGPDAGAPVKSQPTAVPLRIEAVTGDGRALLVDAMLRRDGARFLPTAKAGAGSAALRAVVGDRDAVWLDLDPGLIAAAKAGNPLRLVISTIGDEKVEARYPADKAYEANCALVLHGNQGLGYTEVFYGRGDDPDGSGFDEAMQIHEATGVPGNFHLSGTLQSSAEWMHNNGDPIDFNGWLAAGASAGWAGLLSSAYAQHIMPFVQNAMNDWSINVLTQMVNTRYGYFPLVAWIPERVWLYTDSGPTAGVSDWIGDNWQPHGVQGVILDDDVHLAGHDNHQIHYDTNGLRLIPRDRAFTGNIVGGNGQASLDILTGLAGSGVGEFRIVVFAEDWEAVAEMGIWATTTPFANDTYNWFVQKCADESAWLHTWKLADALGNPDFNGATFSPTGGTYGEIGGAGGYGGSNNAWYTHWAGFIPYANGGDGSGSCAGGGGNCKDYGTLWNDAHNALQAAPDNNISQAGWYVLMTNLHETAWHDGLGGPISGWQHKYSSHIKNASIYAEAAHWANDEYVETTAAFWSDIDNDGYDEVVVHNDKLMAVFETIGGRATHLFVKGPAGLNDTAIGVDNAYWSDTEGDYNDPNHTGAFSDVSPNYQHDLYTIEIVSATGPTVRLRLTRNEVTKEVSLTSGDSFFDVVYRVGPSLHWFQSGFSPSLVDLVWNAQMDRVWVGDQAYMGQRNPNTGIATAWIVGTGGASHQRDFTGTLMKGDELKGEGTLQCKLFAGPTSAPGGGGEIAELRALATLTTDTIGPRPETAQYFPAAEIMRIVFDQQVDPLSADVTGFGVDENGDGLAEVTLAAGTTISETAASYVLTLQLDPASASALGLLDPSDLLLLVDAGSLSDTNANPNLEITEADAVPVDVVDTKFPIDGQIEIGDWDPGFNLPDPGDSGWTAANEIDALYATWDELYLYVGLDGIVSANSWIIYFDVDPGTANGQTDLTAIDAWERGATFVAPGFAADFQYGCYQHQGPSDSDSFFEILSPTATQNRTGEIISAFDSQHIYGGAGGSELAIPWNTLYGLGDNAVPPGASISIVASLCWDPEPDGVLGGDSAPNNVTSSLPEIDTVWTFSVDRNSDGEPDRLDLVPVPGAPAVGLKLLPAAPNPFNPITTISFELPEDSRSSVNLVIYDLQGRHVRTVVSRPLPAGRHDVRWNGQDDGGRPVAAGTYIMSLRYRGQVKARPLSLIK